MDVEKLNPNGVGALLKARAIQLTRCNNGWLVKDANRDGFVSTVQPFFCFESTASLAKHLVAMLGETKWVVEGIEPPRAADGKFTKKSE